MADSREADSGSQLFARKAPAYSPHDPCVFLLPSQSSAAEPRKPAGSRSQAERSVHRNDRHEAAFGINRRVLGDEIPVRASP